MKPTDAEIHAEIDWLKTNKPNIRHYSSFGEDHHRAIDEQIHLLEKLIAGRYVTSDDIWDAHPSDSDYDLVSTLEGTLAWATGTRDADPIQPSKEWASLLRT